MPHSTTSKMVEMPHSSYIMPLTTCEQWLFSPSAVRMNVTNTFLSHPAFQLIIWPETVLNSAPGCLIQCTGAQGSSSSYRNTTTIPILVRKEFLRAGSQHPYFNFLLEPFDFQTKWNTTISISFTSSAESHMSANTKSLIGMLSALIEFVRFWL
jgi:hypothetical protein